MVDLGSLSNEQLIALRQSASGESDSPTTPGVKRVTVDTGAIGKPLAELSNEELLALRKSVPSGTSALRGIGSALDAGVAHGIASLGGLPRDSMDIMAAGTNALRSRIDPNAPQVDMSQDAPESAGGAGRLFNAIRQIPGSKQIGEAIQRTFYDGEKPYIPQNKPEEYAKTIGEFLPAGVGGAGRNLASRAANVLLPAVASETAGQVTKGTSAEPYARFGGALVGGGAGALLSRPSSTAQAIRSQLPDGVTPQMVDQAEALIARAGQQGIDLAWPEALSQVAGRPVLTNTMRHLEASPQTEARMAEFFGGRDRQVEGAARREFDNIAPVNNAPYSIGKDISRTADETVGDVRKIINKASEPYYKAAETVILSPQEMSLVRRIPGFDEAREAVRSNPQINWRVAHLPDESVGFLNQVKKHFDQAAENSGSKFNPAKNKEVQSSNEMAASALKQIGELKSPDYAAALKIQAESRERFLQPLLDGPLGQLAKKDVTTQKAIDTLFPTRPLANSEAEIGTSMRALVKRNPKAAEDLTRSYVESVFNRAAKDLQTGANQAGGAKFRAQLVADPQQRLNLREAVEALPNGSERWRGFNALLETLEATGTRQGIGSRTAYNAEINANKGLGGLVSDTVKTGANPMRLGQKYIDRWERYKLGKDLNDLARLLTDPKSAGMLRNIANVPPSSDQARILATRLLTYAEASGRAPVDKSSK